MADFSRAIEVLQLSREHCEKQLEVARTEIEYVQAQIDYDKAHRPENTKDLPGFEKRLAKAIESEAHYAAEVRDLTAAIERLDGES